MADKKHQSASFVVGVGTTKFEKPFSRKWDYPDMAREAGNEALRDAGISYNDIDAVVASYCYGDPASGQRAVYELGLTGVPVFNTNNNCSSASSALMLARLLILSGQYKCVLAIGFEKMERGLSEKFTDRASPISRHVDHMHILGARPGLVNPHLNAVTSDIIKLFAYAFKEHSERHGSNKEQLAKIAYKNHRHSVNNPKASINRAFPLEKILNGRAVCDPITLAMAAPTADGGAAAVLCNQEVMTNRGLEANAVEILAQQMVTDLPSSFAQSYMDTAGCEMAKRGAEFCFKSSGLTAKDVDVLEVHDCFAPNELFMYEAMGLCEEGKGGDLIDSGKWIKNKQGGEVCQLGNRWVVNPSGGLESKGHPIGATGLAQCAELNWQLRGLAGKRQVEGAKVGLQHNYGIGGAAVVTLYRKHKPTIHSVQLTAKL